MRTLELKIPPPVVALLLASAMWVLSLLTPPIQVPGFYRLAAAVAIALMGAGFDLAAVITFLRRHTTVNPMKPQNTSVLVCSGVYKLTRNPMYVGLLCFLIAWAVYLSSAWALLGPVAFVLYINRFQIRPEEDVLLIKYGDRYSAYKSRVRRWL
jgi:protein-S-isoprenylcysteine O-methyltransferase Ste14